MPEIRTKSLVCTGGVPAFLALPERAKAPVVVVVHERYGLVQHIRDLAERFARDGYVAIAPDCFFKHPDPEAVHRGAAGYELSDPEAVEVLTAAIEALAEVPQADTSRLAVMGICQTGRLPLVMAAERALAAALVWYGAAQPREWAVNAKYPRALEEIMERIEAPVLGMFGERDHLISVADVRRFRDCLERHDKSFEIHLYGDAPHGWLNDTMPGRYRRPQAEQAWADQRAFLERVLAPGYDPSRRIQRYAVDFAADYDFTKQVRLE